VSSLVTTIHVIICLVLIIAVLLQSGKAADLAGTFGGVGSQKVFGPRGAGTILSKVTTISAILFMFTSLGLWLLSDRGGKSIMEQEKAQQTVETQKKEDEQKAPATEQKPQQPEHKKEQEK